MKSITIIAAVLLAAFTFSCKSGESLSKQESITETTPKIESGRYTFVPRTALPAKGSSISLATGNFSLKISKDSIDSYLPYYGRLYSAPTPGITDGGIKFLSTDFDYNISDKGKGNWEAVIQTKDGPKKYKLRLKMGDNGSATLSVQESSMQSISFYGKIE